MSMPGTPTPAALARAENALANTALSYPEVVEENPWGHRAFKVRGKTFLFLGASGEGLSLSTKLPESGMIALTLPFAEPTGYGLGKSGWVSARFGPKDSVPLPIMSSWIDESYRAIAPKKLSATLSIAKAASHEPSGKTKPPSKAKVAKKPAAKASRVRKIASKATKKPARRR